MKLNKKYFNIVDLILIFSIILCTAFAVNVIISDIVSNIGHEIEYIIKVSEADFISKSALRIGDSLFTNNNKTNIGTISNIEFKPSFKTEFNYITNEFENTEIVSRYDVYLTVNATAYVQDNIYEIDGVEIIANTYPEIKFPFLYDKVEIITISKRHSDNIGG